MYKNILVTGANGFIGKNLIKKLKTLSINIYTFNRENTFDDLEQVLTKVDFIFHLAGEVKPKSSKEDFVKGNLSIVKIMINKIEKLGLKIPILMVSSIHAIDPVNDYGITKRAAEEILIEYHKKYNIPVYIYRLPHLFGEQCKPNYNSVISTWIYNSIHDLDIVVYDRNIPMTYVYVQDFISKAIEHLDTNTLDIYHEIDKSYQTTLGEVRDMINEFHRHVNEALYIIEPQGFKNKLFEVYKDYHEREK